MNASADLGLARVAAVRTGRIAPLGPDGIPSAFRKAEVTGPVLATALGLAGDTQADLSVHGGIDKAVYGYATHHYIAWARDFPARAAQLTPGSMGENLCIDGINEAHIHIGDVIRHGDAVLQVTQPREPCFKLALAFDAPKLVRAMTRSGRSGWYYRVIDSGAIGAGDALTLIDRPNPGWPMARFNAALLPKAPEMALIAEMTNLAGLTARWHARLTTLAVRR